MFIITNKNSILLYTGVTNDLERRLAEHTAGLVKVFSARYRLNRLLWFENTANVRSAITREKQIKGWLRSKKVALINSLNPEWKDLAADWFQHAVVRDSSLRSE